MRRLWLLAAAIVLLTGCTSARAEMTEKPKIVATCFPQYDMARQIAGEYAEVSLLLSAGQEIHSFEPTPMDVAEIARCDLFLRIGGESESWTDTMLASLDTSQMKIVTLMDCIPSPIEEEEHEGHHHEEEEAEFDEHIWNSPVNAIAMTEAVRDALCEADAAHEEVYQSRADEYIEELSRIDEEFRELARTHPGATILVADRFPFRYLTAEYGFSYVAAFTGCSSETEPTLGALYTLLETYRARGGKCIFCLDFSTDKIAGHMREMTGAKVLKLHPCHTLSSEEMERGTTLPELMEENYQAIREGIT